MEGIGEVELHVKSHRTQTGSNHQDTITLTSVCYAPGAPCNIMGRPALEDYTLENTKDGLILRDYDDGRLVAVIEEGSHSRLRLTGQSKKSISLEKYTKRFLCATLPLGQRLKWYGYNEWLQKDPEYAYDAELAPEEEQWSKQHWFSESEFVWERMKLNATNSEDLAQGRSLLRCLMTIKPEEWNSVTFPMFQKDGKNIDDAELEDGKANGAKFYFSASELEWVRRFCGNMQNFMNAHGLYYCSKNDCKKAQPIVESLMAGSEGQVSQMEWGMDGSRKRKWGW